MDNDIVEQLRMLGAPPEVIAAAIPAAPIAVDFLVWEDNWRAVSLFSGLATQWRMHIGMAGVHYQGLDYTAVETTLRLERVPRVLWTETFRELQVMERAALPLLNESKQ